jgi:diamine N-acetyltransferase
MVSDSETVAPGDDATVTLREVSKETVGSIIRLKVSPGQEQFVASNAVSIAQAYFDRETAWFRGIYADDVPVGFVMLSDDPAKEEYFLWRFMIDARYQGHGFGRRAIELLIEYVRTRPGAKALMVSCVPGDGSPCPFYEKLGFIYTGEVDEDELVLRLDL